MIARSEALRELKEETVYKLSVHNLLTCRNTPILTILVIYLLQTRTYLLKSL